MFKGEFDFNFEDALTTFQDKYSSTYAATNEPIEQWMKLTPVSHAPRVLTVAASGDQPLMYAAAGASHVDTFDITIYACAAMDFKTSALQQLSYSDYLEALSLLKRFRYLEALKIYGFRAAYNLVMNTISNMPQRTRRLMQCAIDVRPAAFERDHYNKNVFPSDEQTYQKMRQNIKSPFNFIWADLMNVSNYIEDKYDIINTSNIFEHYMAEWQNKPAGAIIQTIQKLLPHVNNDGYIFAVAFDNLIPNILDQNKSALRDMPIRICMTTPTGYRRPKAIVIQKTR